MDIKIGSFHLNKISGAASHPNSCWLFQYMKNAMLFKKGKGKKKKVLLMVSYGGEAFTITNVEIWLYSYSSTWEFGSDKITASVKSTFVN